MRRFAKRLGLEFDIENMEISLLTKQKASAANAGAPIHTLSEEQQELIGKRDNFERISDYV